MLRFLRDDTERVLLEVIDYLMAEVRVLRQKYDRDCGRRLLLNDEQRRELAAQSSADEFFDHTGFRTRSDPLGRARCAACLECSV